MSDEKNGKNEQAVRTDVPLGVRMLAAGEVLMFAYSRATKSYGEEAALLALVAGGQNARDHVEEKHPALSAELAKIDQARADAKKLTEDTAAEDAAAQG